MVQRVVRSPKALLVLAFGTILGAVWAAGSAATAASKPTGGVSLTPGPGISMSPNPITTTGAISVSFGGNGAADTVSHSDHNHDGLYLPLSGGTVGGALGVTGSTMVGGNLSVSGVSSLSGGASVSGSLNVSGLSSLGNATVAGTLGVSGNLTLGHGAQLIAPVIENALVPPSNPAPGQLWWNTTNQVLQYFDGAQWQAVPSGAAASPILGVSTSTAQASGTQVFQVIGPGVTFTLSAQTTVAVEFGAEYEIPSASNRGDLNLYPLTDGNPPQFIGQDSAHYSQFSSNNTTDVTTQCSRLVTRVLQSGSHTITLQATISSDLGATIRNPWLKVTKM